MARTLNNDTFTIVLFKSYEQDKEKDLPEETRELHLTFSKSFLESEDYIAAGSPGIPERMAPEKIEQFAIKMHIFTFLHNVTGPAVQRFSILPNGTINEAKNAGQCWINGEQLPMNSYEQGADGKPYFTDGECYSAEALAVLHGKKIQEKVASILKD